MACVLPMPIYRPITKEGLTLAISLSDGYQVSLEWTRAYPSSIDYQVAYNVYYSTNLDHVFSEGVKTVVPSETAISGDLYDFTPGDVYYFAIRATQYDPAWYNLAFLPDGAPDLKVYPESVLLSNITDTSTSIPVSDISLWPPYGIAKIGVELIRYSSLDIPTNSLLLTSILDRGYLNTTATLHQTDGYDGNVYQDPFVKFFTGFEEFNTVIFQATSTFKDTNYAFTYADGYRITTEDNLTTDLSATEANQTDFITYDYSGWHRTNPVALLNGECVGSYFGGERFCADGYGVGFQLRGIPFADELNRRLEVELSLRGVRMVLVKRLWAGLTCSCFEPSHETPQLRCPRCYSTGFVTGYQQYFNPRESDGRILVSVGATEDSVKLMDEGLESVFLPDAWTLSVPIVKNRDFLIRFNEDGSEEFRYEVLAVSRGVLLNGVYGAQKFKLQRVRKTDPIYTWKYIASTATIPQVISTGIGLLPGPNGTFIPHLHEVHINENILNGSQITQTTSTVLGHSHEVYAGVVQDMGLGHTHALVV